MIEVAYHCSENCCDIIIDTDFPSPPGWDDQVARPMFEHIDDFEYVRSDLSKFDGYVFLASDLDVPGVRVR